MVPVLAKALGHRHREILAPPSCPILKSDKVVGDIVLPRDPGEDDWKGHLQSGDAAPGALGESFRAALEKKKR